MDTGRLKHEMEGELVGNILPFWMTRMKDEAHGGFYGRITGAGELVEDADKGAILNARILWTFSSAYRLLRHDDYLQMATRAKDYLIAQFYDAEYGGIYWSLDYKGWPLDTKKQIYAIAFAIYGLSEYCRATGDSEALTYAIRLYNDIEQHSFDSQKNGYYEAFTREWNEIDDMRLSDKDENERKTMNTHLHVLEAYTGLYRVWKDEQLGRQLRNLVELFTERILDKATCHLNLFFDDDWRVKTHVISYGHDIEASWLINEAALVLGDKTLLDVVKPIVKRIALAADDGLQSDGSLAYETKHTGHTDLERHWWVQAECVVGHVNLYQYYDDVKALDIAFRCWEFIKAKLIDTEQREWYWSIDADGKCNLADDKAGFWKCPYHNGRMCMEMLERL